MNIRKRETMTYKEVVRKAQKEIKRPNHYGTNSLGLYACISLRQWMKFRKSLPYNERRVCHRWGLRTCNPYYFEIIVSYE